MEKTIVGVYSERYKGGPVLETDMGIIYLINLEKSEFEGKTLLVTGTITQDKDNVVGPYKPGEPISQGWEAPRLVMVVTKFELVK
ncbi:Uncharacterised protein [Candidatus Bilamarchaeum dharawalense]|uniref:Uncharacterized protein n=1 Tax=Candidatus Bilamarchaeum dharawalense TaxID=2885759 RepID=A0A5E4LPQ8_9ARCH|nr:Uncharacterised protein [Candidatus Bilamarchaeum dharawalense]